MNLQRTERLLIAMLLIISASITDTFAWGKTTPLTQITEAYKMLPDNDSLIVEVVAPEGFQQGATKKGMVFYFGGGWINGNIDRLRPQATYFAEQGLVCFLVQYRTKKSHQATPNISLMDAKSSIRYIKTHADRFNIDADDLITCGGSAGGHLAAAVSMCPNINDPQDDTSIATTVGVNVLFNPVVCNGAGKSGKDKGYGYDRVADYYKEFSPYHNVRKGAPNTIFLVGSEDHLIDEEMAYEYKRRLEEVGSRCDVKIYEGEKHGFYSPKHKKNDVTMFVNTVRDGHNFLRELGYIKGKCKIEKWTKKNYPDSKY